MTTSVSCAMVQFGKRFETSQTRRWLRHNVDYERLKLLLELVSRAHERNPGATRQANFGVEGGARGLLEETERRAWDLPTRKAGGAVLARGLEPRERAALATLLERNLKTGAAGGLKRASSLTNLAALAQSPGGADETSTWHWTRWLFSSEMPESRVRPRPFFSILAALGDGNFFFF